jgi:hypothetical protein
MLDADGKIDKNPKNPVRIEDWLDILKKCYEIANDSNALHYIAFKTPYSFKTIIEYGLDLEQALKALYMPVRQANEKDKKLNKDRKFIYKWCDIKDFCDMRQLLAGFEVNFKEINDNCFHSYDEYGGLSFIQYINQIYKVRVGVFSEEPVGPKGMTNRFAEWNIKDLETDKRGDHAWLLSKIAVPGNDKNLSSQGTIITTDRPDIWAQMEQYVNIYIPSFSNSIRGYVLKSDVAATADNIVPVKSADIHVRYESGTIIISDLTENDMGSHVALYDLQGRLIYKGKIKMQPQMIISKNLQPGIFILKISGDRHIGVKLIVNK